MSAAPVSPMRPQFAAPLRAVPAARHAPPARSGPLPALRAVRLLDQLRERIRYLHYSLRTEEAYAHWVRAFIRFHGLRHPGDLGGADVERFLTWLVSARAVSESTHRQALSAWLFLYGKVLGVDLPWMAEIGRPSVQRRLPVVLSRDEVACVLKCLEGEHRLLAHLLYGTGLRMAEALQLRVKDLDFAHRAIVVRHGKGGKDRVVMLPESLAPGLRDQLGRARRLWATDQAHAMPALGPAFPGAARTQPGLAEGRR